MLVGELVKWPQFWPFEPQIHLNKSCDLSTPLEYERISTCLDGVYGYVLKSFKHLLQMVHMIS